MSSLDTQKPTITLKSFTFNSAMTDETPCYMAKLFAGDKYICDVQNRGHGGPDQISSGRKTVSEKEALKAYQDLNKLVGETYPQHSYEADGKTNYYDESLETLCHIEIFRLHDEKRIKRLLNNKIIFLEKEDPNIYQIGYKPTNMNIQMVKRNNQNIEVVLNELPFEEAFKKLT